MTLFRLLMIAGACVLVGGFFGFFLGRSTDDEDSRLSSQVIDLIEDNYYKDIDRKELEDASLEGIVRSLGDRFSQYLTPADRQRFEQSFEGSFEGVGMNVNEVKRGLVVVNVFDGSPADKAGIRKDDVITRVDGKSIAGEPAEVSTAKIKGKPGTTVTLEVVTPGNKRKRRLEIERERIELPVVRAKMRNRDGQKVGVVELVQFSDGSHGRLRSAIDKLLDRGAKGIVLDLRGDPGGLLNEAVLVASVFIEDGVVVSTEGRKEPRRVFKAEGDAIDSDVPVVVLVDRGSASSSEIVTGALRDRKRATVVGTRTFGKGVFQEFKDLSNGGAIDLTIGRYYLPSGKPVSRKGIPPQVKARDNPRTERDEALPVALEVLLDKSR
jgi:carboxyl-terminal processing protease